MNNEVMSLTNFLEELKEKGETAVSKYQMRNEANQTKVKVKRFPKLKKEVKKKSKLLVFTELAIPFNPLTGEADEKYNADNKFRPTLAAETTALMLKKEANTNEKTKEAFMRRAGVDTWDTSKEEFTEEDAQIFKKYRVPRIFSVPVVNINIPVMTKDYSRNYILHVDRDPRTGELIGEEPLCLTANRFFRTLAYAEVEEYKDQVDKGLVTDDKEMQKKKISNILQKVPVSDDHPSNWIMLAEMPLQNNYTLSSDIKLAGMSSESVTDYIRCSNYSKGIRLAIEKYIAGDYAKYDTHFGFYEIDMAGPASGDTPAQIGLDTTYEKPTEALSDSAGYENAKQAIIEYTDNLNDLEDVMLASMRLTEYDDQVEAQLAKALKTVIDVNSKYLTDEVITAFAPFLTIVLGAEGEALITKAAMNDALPENGQADNENKFDLNQIMQESQQEINNSLDDVAADVDVEIIDPVSMDVV